jgi:hypothetical protein
MAKAGLPEAQFGGVYGRHHGERRVVKPCRNVRVPEQWTHPMIVLQQLHNTMSAIPSHLKSSRFNERTGRLTMSQLNHVEMQDRLSWCVCSVSTPVWRRSLYSTQRLPVMGLAARTLWISQSIRRGNTFESQTLRGRETVPGIEVEMEVMRMLTMPE